MHTLYQKKDALDVKMKKYIHVVAFFRKWKKCVWIGKVGIFNPLIVLVLFLVFKVHLLTLLTHQSPKLAIYVVSLEINHFLYKSNHQQSVQV